MGFPNNGERGCKTPKTTNGEFGCSRNTVRQPSASQLVGPLDLEEIAWGRTIEGKPDVPRRYKTT